VDDDETLPEIDKDMLRSLFAMQASLNDHVFKKNGIADTEGNPLTMQVIAKLAEAGRLAVNDLPNQWLARYSKAMGEELTELDAEVLWKWWSKDKIDIQNIRVELIDILHFLISAMICAGLSADRVFDIYKQKHAVNLARQDTGYNKATKTEDDNRAIE
jgi:dimeric dUTPase (all-alpha-NTP-PPase superfamily)